MLLGDFAALLRPHIALFGDQTAPLHYKQTCLVAKQTCLLIKQLECAISQRYRSAKQRGERDLAIEQLETLAKIPAGVFYGDMRLNPYWDSLRGDPRFEKIVTELAPAGAR